MKTAKTDAIEMLREELAPFELRKEETEALVSIARYLRGESAYAPIRTAAIKGHPGTGKTHLAHAVAKAADARQIHLTADRLTDKSIILAADLKDLAAKTTPGTPTIIIIDPIERFIQEVPFSDRTSSESLCQQAWALDTIRQTPLCAGLIITEDCINSEVRQKIDITIPLGLPRDRLKAAMIEQAYPSISRKHTELIAGSTPGYSLTEIKQAMARMLLTDNGALDDGTVRKILARHTPASLSHFKLATDIQSSLDDIIGKEHVKGKLRRAARFMERSDELKKKGIKRPNIFVFHGPPGTGKTHTARALAGELQWPFIHIDMQQLKEQGPVLLQRALRAATRFKRCIVFVDDADILVGHDALEKDGIPQGAIISTLDGIDGTQEGIVILAMNQKESFGQALYDRAVSIYFDKPSKDERTQFFEEKRQASGIPADHKRIGEMTDGMSYRQLEKIWDDIAFEHIANEEKGEPAFEEIIRKHKARTTSTMFG